MKNSILKLFLLNFLIASAGICAAQSIDTDGVWKLSEMNEGGEIYPVQMHIVFNESGAIEFSGRNVGTWSINKTENTISISCPYLGVLEGESNIEKLDDTELIIRNANGDINSLKNISLPKNKQLKNKITGEWLLETIEENGEKVPVGQLAEFNKNGIFYMQGMVFGTWGYIESSDQIILDNEEFKGECPILSCNANELIINADGDELYFSKFDKQKIIIENNESGLLGVWKFKGEPDPYANTFVKFNDTGEFKIIIKQESMRSELNGLWVFNKQERSLMMIGLRSEDIFAGKNIVVKIDEDAIEIENNGKIFKGNRKVQDVQKIERLTFTQDDFFTEDGDYKYEDEEAKLPWQDYYARRDYLSNIEFLIYDYSILIEGTATFETKSLTADVMVDEGEGSIIIEYVFNGWDHYNFPEGYELPTENFDNYSPLYPLKGSTFRVVAEEEITTAAGTYSCTVIEALSDSNSEEYVKLWMINDKPGVIAKIIIDKPGRYGYYTVYELTEIER